MVFGVYILMSVTAVDIVDSLCRKGNQLFVSTCVDKNRIFSNIFGIFQYTNWHKHHKRAFKSVMYLVKPTRLSLALQFREITSVSACGTANKMNGTSFNINCLFEGCDSCYDRLGMTGSYLRTIYMKCRTGHLTRKQEFYAYVWPVTRHHTLDDPLSLLPLS